MAITARQLANSYLARLANELIELAEIREEKAAELGRPTTWGRCYSRRIAKEAGIAARTFWEDLQA